MKTKDFPDWPSVVLDLLIIGVWWWINRQWLRLGRLNWIGIQIHPRKYFHQSHVETILLGEHMILPCHQSLILSLEPLSLIVYL